MDLTGMLQAAAGSAGGGLLIQEVFSTTLYTGNGTTRTITNGIDLDGEGGLVWVKGRSIAADNRLFDTLRGAANILTSNSTGGGFNDADVLSSFNNDGFSFGGGNSAVNLSGSTYVSWSFRKAPKFFDVVTYTGTGSPQNISHNLGSVPGCIIVKCTNTATNWIVYHRGVAADPETDALNLNGVGAISDSLVWWNDTAPTDSVFTVGSNVGVNGSGNTYVAYLFAHDAGGFNGENAISCSSYVGNGSATGPTVTLGYEPQWLIIKRAEAGTSNWTIYDSKRDATNPRTAYLLANTSGAEQTGLNVDFNATGFQIKTSDNQVNQNTGVYIYIAIRADM